MLGEKGTKDRQLDPNTEYKLSNYQKAYSIKPGRDGTQPCFSSAIIRLLARVWQRPNLLHRMINTHEVSPSEAIVGLSP